MRSFSCIALAVLVGLFGAIAPQSMGQYAFAADGAPVISALQPAPKQYKLGERTVPGPLPPNPEAAMPDCDIKNDIIYGKAGDIELKLDFAKPKLCDGQKVPLVVFIHGGGWKNGDKRGGTTKPESKMCLQLGFATASLDYRLVPKAIFPAQVEDCKLAIRYLRKNADKLGFDPDRIGIYGSSAGGHLVSILGTANDDDGLEGPGLEGTSSGVKCVVDYFGPTDLTDMGKGYNNLGGIQTLKDFLGCLPTDCQDVAAKASPVTYVDKGDPPILIQHGADDNLVPYDQGVRLAKKYFENGNNCALIKVKNAGHGFAPIKKGVQIYPPIQEVWKKTVSHMARYLEPALLGDLNMDGAIGIDDAIELAYLLGSQGTDENGAEAPDDWNPLADLNADGKIDVSDWDLFWDNWK